MAARKKPTKKRAVTKAAKKKASKKRAARKEASKGATASACKVSTKKKSTTNDKSGGKFTAAELKRAVSKIKKFLNRRDYDAIDVGIELARSLGDPGVFEKLLEGCAIGAVDAPDGYGFRAPKYPKGQLLRSSAFSGSPPAQPYLDYALVDLIAHAPASKGLHKSLQKTRIKELSLCGEEWIRLPRGLADLSGLTRLHVNLCRSLENVDALAGCAALSDLTLEECWRLDDLAGIAGCPELVVLELGDCRAMEKTDFLAGCSSLEKLDLRGSFKNISGLGKCTKLRELYLSGPFTKVEPLASLPDLSKLTLDSCNLLKNVNGLTKCAGLKEVTLSQCDSLLQVDGLAGCADLVEAEFSMCNSLSNVSGVVRCTKLKYLFVVMCDVPNAPDSALTSRKEIAAYQKRLGS